MFWYSWTQGDDVRLVDQDLFAKLMSLPEDQRAEFLDFFGVSNLSKRQMDDLEDTLSTSIALKADSKPGTVH